MDAILGFINANVVLIGFLWGILVKYLPALKNVPNTLIPYMNALLALLTGLAGPGIAHAGILGGTLGGGFFGHIIGAGWSAIQSALLYEVFVRHPIKAVQGR